MHGIEMRQVHFSGRAPIDSYGGGIFRLGDNCYNSSLLCLPSGIFAIELNSNELKPAALDLLFQHSDEIEIVLFGTGNSIEPLLPEMATALKMANLPFELMSTGAAIRTYNVLLSEDRQVAAFLQIV